jgi:nucleotide-binding universal stress UspA family protein
MTTPAALNRRPAIAVDQRHTPDVRSSDAPIIAAVDGSTASEAAIETAVRLALEVRTRIVFVYVRRGPAGLLGAPVYERRLTAKMAEGRRVLGGALGFAARAGVIAEGEILEGAPRRRIVEFARDRGARLVVVGSRRHKLGRSISCGVVRAAGRPVVVARKGQRFAFAGKAARDQLASW